MKTNRWVFGAALAWSFVVLQACGGAGQYQIPNVEPVVKQKPEEDALEAELEGEEAKAPPSKPEGKPAEAKPAEAKPAEAKPAEAKPAEAKPVEAKPATPAPATSAKPEPKGQPAAKPAGKK